ncbi:DUF6618 family protein, partial [[Eubacterium] hominis]|uniref:DUF6618 family protein n=1 Tax=[Eubacterium] hominis TaxID=2764325 RepID=UPI0023DD8E04
MKKANLLNKFEASASNELSIDYDGSNYLIIYGTHVNGGWFAIINHGVSGNLATFDDIHYNTEQIGMALNNYDAGNKIAVVIAAFDEMNKEIEMKNEKLSEDEKMKRIEENRQNLDSYLYEVYSFDEYYAIIDSYEIIQFYNNDNEHLGCIVPDDMASCIFDILHGADPINDG